MCDPLVATHRHDAACVKRSPRLVAVSGGSYLAAAIALVGRWKIVAGEPQHRGEADRLAWNETYALTSPENQRLRRHSRDLVEPRSQLLGGVLTLVTGSVVSIGMVLSFGWFVAWLLAWLHTTAGSLTVETPDGSRVALPVDDPTSP